MPNASETAIKFIKVMHLFRKRMLAVDSNKKWEKFSI